MNNSMFEYVVQKVQSLYREENEPSGDEMDESVLWDVDVLPSMCRDVPALMWDVALEACSRDLAAQGDVGLGPRGVLLAMMLREWEIGRLRILSRERDRLEIYQIVLDECYSLLTSSCDAREVALARSIKAEVSGWVAETKS